MANLQEENVMSKLIHSFSILWLTLSMSVAVPAVPQNLQGVPATPSPNPSATSNSRPVGSVPTTPAISSSSGKQESLSSEADTLIAMATELKVQVDKTNKNILSLKVIQEADEIEHYAHQMKSPKK